MRLSGLKRSAVVVASLMLLGLATHSALTAPPQGKLMLQAKPLPMPQLMFLGQEPFQSGGKELIRYKYKVTNASDYPNEMFAAAPDLPPCGQNTKSARTWVEVYDQSGKRLNTFCAFGKSDDLGQLWFAMESGTVPPSWVYVEMTDRKTNTKYKSNLAETTE